MNTDAFILGTAQFGMKYGINNQHGEVSDEALIQILNFADKHGIRTLDTAYHYGNAQSRLGKLSDKYPHFKYISKFRLIDGPPIDLYQKTLEQLRTDHIEAFLFHNSQDIDKVTPKDLEFLQKKGVILGASIYQSSELEKLLSYDFIRFIQLPYNLLDSDTKKKKLMTKAHQKNICLHVRSLFLQGLFFKSEIPAFLAPLEKNIDGLKKICHKYGLSMHELAMVYAQSNLDVKGFVLGVETVEQLKRNFELFTKKTLLPSEAFHEIEALMPTDPRLISPHAWKELK